jgi:hypothetical protein
LFDEGVFVVVGEIEFGLIWDVGLFYLCGRAIVIDDADLLRLDDALPDDVIEGVIILHSMHPLLRVDGTDGADWTPLAVKRGHPGVFLWVSPAGLRDGGVGLRV